MTIHSPHQLAKMLDYILGRHPDEFGLVPDGEGFVPVKDLLRALGEEAGMRYVRRGHLDEILLTVPGPPIEIVESRIRAKSREPLPRGPAEILPKLLYTCVRERGYRAALEKGIFPVGGPLVVLSPLREMAERMGRRHDPSPVVLIVSVEKCREDGVAFQTAGEALILADYIPAACFTGPPLPKERSAPKETPADMKAPKLSGSYFPDPAAPAFGLPAGKRDRRGTRPGWKKDRKRMVRTEKKKGLPF